MSGGSYEYFFLKLQEFAADVADRAKSNPRRLAFAELMKLAAEAAHAIEWVDSCDFGPGDEDAPIDILFAKAKKYRTPRTSRRFEQGEVIKTLDELLKAIGADRWVFINHKAYHPLFIRNMALGPLLASIGLSAVRIAVEKEKTAL